MTDTQSLQRDDCAIAFECFAEISEPGPIIVLLHGFGMERSAMADLGRRLLGRGVGSAAIGLDLRGHGETRAPEREQAYGYPDMRDDLLAFLSEHAGAGAHLVGHSMGGQVALLAAIERPASVRSLSLIGAGPCREVTHEKERRSWERAARNFESGPREQVAHTLAAAAPTRVDALTPERVYGAADGALLARVVRGGFLRVEGNEEACAALQTPTLLIAGAEDEGWLDPTRKLAALVPDAELCVIADSGHLVHLERPDRCADEIVAFLGRTKHA